MKVALLPTSGNSSKFLVTTKKDESFTIALSYTLRKKIWKLADEASELAAAVELAEAIVSRHNPAMPFSKIYILGEHNTQPTLDATIKRLRSFAI